MKLLVIIFSIIIFNCCDASNIKEKRPSNSIAEKIIKNNKNENYQSFSGSINEDSVILNMTVFEKIESKVFIQLIIRDKEPIDFIGSLNNSVLELKHYECGSTKSILEGQVLGYSFQGSLFFIESKKKVNFKLNKNQNQKGNYKIYLIKDSILSTDGIPAGEYNINIILNSDSIKNADINQTLFKTQATFFDNKPVEKSISLLSYGNLLKEILKKRVNSTAVVNSKSYSKQIYERENLIVSQNRFWVSLLSRDYVFTGKNDLYSSININLDVKNNKEITFDDIFRDDDLTSDKIEKILKDEIIRKGTCLNVKELESTLLTKKFCLLDKGILFLYPTDDVDSNMPFDNQVYIPFTRINNLLKTDFLEKINSM